MKILVIDAQGGGVGKALITRLRKEFPDSEILAVGTNSAATNAMLKAGADRGATGENPIRVLVDKVDVITGPIGIIIADAMMGEITAAMANAVSSSDTRKVLIPFQKCGTMIAGVKDLKLADLIEEAVRAIRDL